ncbi:MAG: DUF2938 family protein, partial [Chromatiales bacterium]
WVSVIGGFVGSVFMDVTEAMMGKFGISSGVSGAYIGRWVKGLTNGIFRHRNIVDATPVKNETLIAQIFHYLVGGGVVALFYPIFLEAIGQGTGSNHFALASIFGLVTSVLPWFILMPSFGWGMFGRNAPAGSKPVISPILSHIPYGFGIGLTLTAYYAVVT